MRWKNGIGEYFIGVVTASVVLTLVGMLYPEDKGGVRRALDLFLSLCLLCAVIAPIGGMIADAREEIDLGGFDLDLPDADASAESAIRSALAAESRAMIEKRLEELICGRFDLSEEDTGVTALISVSDNGIEIDRVTIWLSGKALLTDPREIKRFVSEYTDAECEIVGG